MIKDKERLMALLALFDRFNRTTKKHQIYFLEEITDHKIIFYENSDFFGIDGNRAVLSDGNLGRIPILADSIFTLETDVSICGNLIHSEVKVKTYDLIKGILDDSERTDLIFEKIKFYIEEEMSSPHCPVDEFAGDFDGDTVGMIVPGAKLNRNPSKNTTAIRLRQAKNEAAKKMTRAQMTRHQQQALLKQPPAQQR